MRSMKDRIAAAAFLVCAQSGHGLWNRLHVPPWIFVRSLKISSMRSTVEVELCAYDFFQVLGLGPPWMCLGVPWRVVCSCRGVVLPLIG